ncbi:MAG: ferric reductase [Bacteroidetes bacterium]|nr:ferric reductase [Bacteroidota bacterium]
MKAIRRNYGWVIVTLLASLPLIIVANMVEMNFTNGFSIDFVEVDGVSSLGMLYHVTGEFAIRWMTAVLTCTPFFILFGVNNLFVRQAMGIATAVWSLLHFIIFIWAEGLAETFTQVNYIAGFIAVLILIPLLMTSNRKSMNWLKSTWKKLQSFAYLAVFLSLLHVALLDKTWMIYAIVVGLGFLLRIPIIKNKIIAWRTKTR